MRGTDYNLAKLRFRQSTNSGKCELPCIYHNPRTGLPGKSHTGREAHLSSRICTHLVTVGSINMYHAPRLHNAKLCLFALIAGLGIGRVGPVHVPRDVAVFQGRIRERVCGK